MKIVSQFSDYYDHVAETYYCPGAPKVEYHRRTEHCSPAHTYRIKEKLSTEKIESIRYFSDKRENWSINFFAIGFCGRLHRGVQISTPDITEVSYTLSGTIYLPRKHGIQIPMEIQDNAEKHFNLWEDYCSDACLEVEDPAFIIIP